MRKLILFFLLISATAHAQSIRGDRFVFNTVVCTQRSGAGSPEGSITGKVCDTYVQTDGTFWTKKSGSGNTGWVLILSLDQQTANKVLASATSGGSATPAFRSLVLADLPTTTAGQVLTSGTTASYSANPSVSSITLTSTGTGMLTSGNTLSDTYSFQAAGWKVTRAGEGDFRYLYSDELHAKSFIADLEQALAGGQVISKSVTKVASAYTVPASGGASTITVFDLPSAPGMAVFVSGDIIWLRTFSRSSGALNIASAWGVVTSHVDNGNGTQSWTFTRSATFPGNMSTSTVIPIESIVLDIGVSGNGFYQVSAADFNGMNISTPYARIMTFTTTPSGSDPTFTVRTVFGQLSGVTGSSEFGLFAGDYGATGAGKYLKLSTLGAEFHGIPIRMYNSTTQVIRLSPFADDDTTVAPQLSMGNPAPANYGSGTGMWTGIDSGTYKWRVGTIGGAGLAWDGTNMNVNGTGAFTSASGTVIIGNSGISVNTPTAFAGTNSYRFTPATVASDHGYYTYENVFTDAPDPTGFWTRSDAIYNTTSDDRRTFLTLQVGNPSYAAQIILKGHESTWGTPATNSVITYYATTHIITGDLLPSVNGGTNIGSTTGLFCCLWINQIVVGAPTGGAKGAGTINASAVYDDNVLLTDWVFDLAYTGKTNIKHSGKLMSLSDTLKITQEERRLPWMPSQENFELNRSLGKMATGLWQGQEQQQLYIFQLNDRITVLERELEKLKKVQ